MSQTITNNEHLKYNVPSIWIPLIDINVDDTTTYYYTSSAYSITISGNNYSPFPFELEDFSQDSNGEATNIRLVCGNIEGLLSSKIQELGSIDGQTINFKICIIPKPWQISHVYSVGDTIYTQCHIFICTTGGTSDSTEPTWNSGIGGYTNDSTVVWKEDSANTDNILIDYDLEILSVGPVTTESITFIVGNFNPYLIKLLQEKYLKNFCFNVYKGDGCYIKQQDNTYLKPNSAAFSATTCDKTIYTCSGYDKQNTSRFNSFLMLANKGGRFV